VETVETLSDMRLLDIEAEGSAALVDAITEAVANRNDSLS